MDWDPHLAQAAPLARGLTKSTAIACDAPLAHIREGQHHHVQCVVADISLRRGRLDVAVARLERTSMCLCWDVQTAVQVAQHMVLLTVHFVCLVHQANTRRRQGRAHARNALLASIKTKQTALGANHAQQDNGVTRVMQLAHYAYPGRLVQAQMRLT